MITFVSKEAYLKMSHFISFYAPRWLVLFCGRIRILWKKLRMPEQKKAFGEKNPDKTFFVIRFYPPATGLLANYMYVLGIMEYADKHGWIPVIDMENYETFYNIDQSVHGTKNVWEHYFLQPEKDGVRYSLDEVYKSQNVILSSGVMDECYCTDECYGWQIKQNNKLGFHQEVNRFVLDRYNSLVPQDTRVIGVNIRGRSAKRRLSGNYIQATVDDLIPILREKIRDWNCDAVFVKSDEQEPIEEICNAFPEIKILYTESNRVNTYIFSLENGYDDALLGKGDDLTSTLPRVYLNQLEYLADIFILSQCTSLISGYNNGFFVARIWNGGRYEHIEIIDKGKYK